MSVPAAYLGIIIIWSTTPLAIKWSSEDVGFLFGVSARMLLGVVICSLLMLVMTRKLSWHRSARRTYMAGSFGIFGSMMSVYWGAQFIPSGLVSVLFGLTPIVTGLMASLYLDERAMTPSKLTGVVLGIAGLLVIFGNNIDLGEQAAYGIIGVLLSVLIHSASAVWVKSINARLPALEVTNGSLLFAAPLYFISWLVFDGHWPQAVTPRAGTAIIYLAIFGSVIGFIMYYYVLKHIEASRVALVTLITPALALLLGRFLNHESLSVEVMAGTACIFCGMLVYQWGANLDVYFKRQ